MIVSAARHYAETAGCQRPGERASVLHDGSSVVFELRTERLSKGDSLGRDDVHERTALTVREHCSVQRPGVAGLAERHRSPGTPECLVRGAGDDVGVRYGRRVHPGRDQSGNVGDVGKKRGADIICDCFEPLEIDQARIRSRAGHDHLRPELAGDALDVVVVDGFGLPVDPV